MTFRIAFQIANLLVSVVALVFSMVVFVKMRRQYLRVKKQLDSDY